MSYRPSPERYLKSRSDRDQRQRWNDSTKLPCVNWFFEPPRRRVRGGPKRSPVRPAGRVKALAPGRIHNAPEQTPTDSLSCNILVCEVKPYTYTT